MRQKTLEEIRLTNEVESLKRELEQTTLERNGLAELLRERHYSPWGHVSMKLSMFTDRLIEERNEFEYYATLYKAIAEDLMKDTGRNCEVRPYTR